MIKTLLNADEEPPPGTKVVVEETVLNPPLQAAPAQARSADEIPAQKAETAATATESFEIPEDAKFFTKQSENAEESAPVSDQRAAPLDEDSESLTALMAEIENLEPEEFDRLESEITQAAAPREPIAETPATVPFGNDSPERAETSAPPLTEAVKTDFEAPETETVAAATPHSEWLGAPAPVEESSWEKPVDQPEPTIFQSDYTPPTTAETIRNSGLAWSAGIVFFGAVIFMMIFGWFADLLFGSSPWGLVGGIVLGAIIGFIQFFRISSQIFKK